MINKIYLKLQDIILGQKRSEDHNLQFWREQVFLAISLSMLFFGFFAYIFSIFAAFKQNLIFVLVFDTILYIVAIFVVFNNKITIHKRSHFFFFLLYLIGVIMLIDLGKDGAGYIWLFSYSIMTGIMLGLRAAIKTLIITFFTFIILGIIFVYYQFGSSPLSQYDLLGWIALSINFMFLNVLMTMSIAVIVRGLTHSVTKQNQLTLKLVKEHDELLESNKKIRKEVDLKKQLQQQLYQSQKMEAIGQLAGGVAHDFNNLLTVILGYSDMLLQDRNTPENLRGFIKEILDSGNRASDLTRQLLAFSRKQVLKVKIMNINDVVNTMEKMLIRLIGEHIDLIFKLDNDTGYIKADPGQMEQVIMNLCVNARDAMPSGGQITIKTSNENITKYTINESIKIPDGKYICIKVSDTGQGMDNDTLSHIFEPFYTTKEVGKGTGLGLSTIYGIIKQSNGFIEVSSELGKGSIFKILLPESNDDIISNTLTKVDSKELLGHENIIIIEDEMIVRNVLLAVLKDFGYQVISANNGDEGLELCKSMKTSIDLIITDIVMPKKNGLDFYKEISVFTPNIKILFISGYTDKVNEIRNMDVHFLQKPFHNIELLKKVREILD